MGIVTRDCLICGSSIVGGKCDCTDRTWFDLRGCAYCGVYSEQPEQCDCRNRFGAVRLLPLPEPIAPIEAGTGETAGLDAEGTKAGIAPNSLNTGD